MERGGLVLNYSHGCDSARKVLHSSDKDDRGAAAILNTERGRPRPPPPRPLDGRAQPGKEGRDKGRREETGEPSMKIGEHDEKILIPAYAPRMSH